MLKYYLFGYCKFIFFSFLLTNMCTCYFFIHFTSFDTSHAWIMREFNILYINIIYVSYVVWCNSNLNYYFKEKYCKFFNQIQATRMFFYMLYIFF